MRKFLVRHFEFGTWLYAFGRKWVLLRASRILFPLTVFVGLFVAGENPYDYTLIWADYVALGILAGGYWFGFLHFKYFPWKSEELDDEQMYFYLSGIKKGAIPPYKMTPLLERRLEFYTILVMSIYAASNWKRYRNSIPFLFSIAMIIVYSVWIVQL